MLWLISCCQYFKVNSNEPIKVVHLQKLANQSILNGAYAIEIWQIYQHFISRLKITKTEWKKNFDHLIKREKCFNSKKEIHGLWKYMDFAEHRSWSDAPENSEVVCSLTFYQMGMKGKGNVVLVKVDQFH